MIKQTDSATQSTSNTISIDSSGGKTAEVTIQEVNIESYDKSGIDIADGSSVELTVSGENTVSSNYIYSDIAGIHIAEGSLTIQDDGSTATDDVLNAIAENESYGAGIGSHGYEDFDAAVTITGDLTVNAVSSVEGAGIGSGDEGDFTGTVNISGGAAVTAISGDDGAGIGSGDEGDFTGKLNIQDSTVTAVAGDGDSSVLGSGDDGSYKGQITIGGSSVIHAVGSKSMSLIGSSENQGDGTVRVDNTVQIYDDSESPASAPIPLANLADYIGGASLILFGADGGEAPAADLFWQNVIRQVLAAKEGDTITVDAGARTQLPVSVLEAVQKKNITLVIQWDGGEDISLTAKTKAPEGKRFLLLADLVEE